MRFRKIVESTLVILLLYSCTAKNKTELLNAGISCYNVNDYKCANTNLTKSLAIDGSNSIALLFYAKTNYKLKIYSESLITIHKLLLIDSLSYEAYVLRAEIKLALGDLNSAITDCNKAIAIKPDFVSTYLVKSSVNQKLNDINGAISNLKTALKYEIDNCEIYLKIGILYDTIGDQNAYIYLSKAGELGCVEAYKIINKERPSKVELTPKNGMTLNSDYSNFHGLVQEIISNNSATIVDVDETNNIIFNRDIELDKQNSLYSKAGFKLNRKFGFYRNIEHINEARKYGDSYLSDAYICIENKGDFNKVICSNINITDHSKDYSKLNYQDYAEYESNLLETYANGLVKFGAKYKRVKYLNVSAIEYTFTQNDLPTIALVFMKNKKLFLLQVGTKQNVLDKFKDLKESFDVL